MLILKTKIRATLKTDRAIALSSLTCGTGGAFKAAIKHLCGLVFALGMIQTAHADVVHDNGAPNQTGGTNMSNSMVAEDFSISATTNINNIRFWSIQSSPSDYLGNLSWVYMWSYQTISHGDSWIKPSISLTLQILGVSMNTLVSITSLLQ